MAVFVIPPAAISTIRDRSRSRTVALLDRDHRSRISRSPSVTSILTAFRIWLPLVCSKVSRSRTKRNHNPNQPGLTGLYRGHYTGEFAVIVESRAYRCPLTTGAICCYASTCRKPQGGMDEWKLGSPKP